MELIHGHDAWKTRLPDEDDHVDSCPHHPDAPEVFECGGIDEHLCTFIEREVNGCNALKKPCACPTMTDLQNTIAEEKLDAAREG